LETIKNTKLKIIILEKEKTAEVFLPRAGIYCINLREWVVHEKINC